MAGCEQDAVRRIHGRHVGDTVLVAQRCSPVQPAVQDVPLLAQATLTVSNGREQLVQLTPGLL